tara:strand:- start:195 stop:527 length:333 start_codon:yes stop_codon:yes gene_type:complete
MVHYENMRSGVLRNLTYEQMAELKDIIGVKITTKRRRYVRVAILAVLKYDNEGNVALTSHQVEERVQKYISQRVEITNRMAASALATMHRLGLVERVTDRPERTYRLEKI